MIDEKKLRKSIAIKQKQINEMQADYDREKCKKHIRAFMDELLFEHNDLIPLIINNNLNTTDIRIIAAAISKDLNDTYKSVEPRIQISREKRAKKNEARRKKNRLNKSTNSDPTNTSSPFPANVNDENNSVSEPVFTRKY